jgi:hypothetical protein
MTTPGDDGSGDGKLRTARAAVARAELRMRIGRALAALPTALTLALAAAAVAIAARKAFPGWVEESWARAVVAGAALSVVASVAWAALRRLAPLAGAIALDVHHDLRGRLTNALEFASVPAAARTPLMEAAVEDAACTLPPLSARRAVRVALPGELAVSLCVALGVAALALLEVRLPRPEPPPLARTALHPLEMSADDLDLFRDAVAELERREQSPEVKAAIEQFNQLIEDIANRRLNRTDAFHRMQAIEDELVKGAEADKKALSEALKDTARELDLADLSKPLSQALKKQDLKAASEESKKLADALRGKGKSKPSKQELERLKQALERASKQKQKALEEINERRAEMREQLLKRKNKPPDADAGARDPQEERLIKKNERELERLDREAEKRERALRQLSRLDRDLAKAAADLMRDLGLSAEDLEQAAEDLNRMDQEQMSEEEKEQLRRRLDELRELIRQQGQGGKQRLVQLRKFGRRARGASGGGEGEQGEGQEGKGQKGSGQSGAGEGEGGITLGRGGRSIPVDMGGGSSGAGEEGGGDKPGGQAQGVGGKQWGTGSGGDPKGEATKLGGKTVDVRAEGLDAHGPTNAEVILSAGERGFVGKPYKKVYRDYKTVAEDQVEKEKIPDGMRFYVRRYFQLIRPRE